MILTSNGIVNDGVEFANADEAEILNIILATITADMCIGEYII